MSQSRRTLLKRSAALLGTGTAAGLAGCSDAIDQAEEAVGEFDSGYAAFFSLADWTNQIAGDHADFENPVEVGQMGHGWEPHGDLTADVAATDAFVYLDTPEFSWAQDLADSLESDYDDIAVINGLEGMEDDFLDWDAGDGHGHEDDHDHDDDYDDHDDHGHAHVEELEIIDRGHDEVVADVHGDHWHGSLPDVEEGDYLSLGAEFTDDHGDQIHLGENEEYQLNARVADDADDIVSIESHGDHIHVTGEEEGHTALVFQLYHDDHADWESPPLDLDVGDGHDHGEEEHDHGDHDLHVEEFELIDRSDDEVAASVDGDHWHGSLPAIAEDDYLSLGAHAETEDGDHVHFGEDEEYQLDARVADGEDDDVVSFDSHGDHVHVHGEHHGHVDVVFQIVHDDHVDWESPALEVDVGDEHADGEDGHEDEHDERDDHGHAHVGELDIINRDTDEVIADVHGDHWHGGLPDVEVDDYLSLGAEFVDEDGDHIHLGEDEEYQLNARVADDADENVSIESHGDHIHVTGEEEGSTELVFQLYHDDHADWEAPPLAVSVVPEGEAGEHDHGFFDPHVWVDPVLAKDVVDNIADAFAELDPDNAEAYADNAEAYHAELDEIDAAFEEAVADAPRDVGVLAGHDSFQYLEERYGFDLHSPVGVSPHDEPSQNDIADTIEFVNEHDIDVVLYDRFEDPTLAEAIVENSDATEVLAVTPAEGTTQAWNEEGYGYVDQMLEVNVPAFRRALGGE
ncbi:hypothetical protein JCM17823_09060 [Halorubrum gandharaense]